MTDLPLAEHDLAALVEEWLDWSAAARELGVTEAKVRTMIRDHELAAAVPRPGAGPQVPAGFIEDGLPVKGLAGLLTVLHDGGYDDREVHRLAPPRPRPAGPADRRPAREPRVRGQAPGPGDGALGAPVTWNRQTITWVISAFALVAFVSLMLALGSEERTLPIGGDDPTPGAPPSASVGPDVDSGDTDPESGLQFVREDELPVFAQGTLALIDQGGPFPCDKDGSTFGNFEGLLPDRDRGYYAEFTVLKASGCQGPRGALRIVTGDGGEFFWTEDHYESFERIARRAG